MQAIILQGEWEKVVIFIMSIKSMGGGLRSIWSFARQGGFTDRLLLGSYTKGLFKERIQVKLATFRFFCEKLGPFLQKK